MAHENLAANQLGIDARPKAVPSPIEIEICPLREPHGIRLAEAAELLHIATKEPSTDPTLLELFKSKFVGYFQWTAFAMLFTPVVLWVLSKNHN